MKRACSEKRVIDFPPAYPNSDTYHLGHIYEMFILHVLYRSLDQETRNGLVSSVTTKFLSNLSDKKYDLAINFGYDCNGLPLALKCLNEKNLHQSCRSLARKNSTELLKLAKKYDVHRHRKVSYYFTDDDYFKQKTKEFLEVLKKSNKINEQKKPLMFCPNCQTFLSSTQTSYLDEPSTQYKIKVLVDDKTYEVMSKKPEFLYKAKGLVFHPKDVRYVGLESKTAKLVVNQNLVLQVPIHKSENVNPKAGTGLMYFCNWMSQNDVRISRELNLAEKSQIHDSRGRLDPTRLKQLNFESPEQFLSECIRNKLVEISGPCMTKTLRHTERGSCLAPIVFISSPETTLRLTKQDKQTLKHTIDNLNCNKKYVKEQLTSYLEKHDSWCISRNPKKYYSLEFKDQNHDTKCVDTWVVSALTSTFNNEHSTKKIRIQGSDILKTWAFHTMWVNSLLKESELCNVITHRMVVDSDNNKFSKSKNNHESAIESLEKYDLKTLRTYFLEKPMDKDVKLNEKELDDIKRMYLKLGHLKTKFNLQFCSRGLENEELEKRTLEQNFEDHSLERSLKSFYTKGVEYAEYSNVICLARAELYKISKLIDKVNTEDLLKLYVKFLLITDFFNFFENYE